jgi:hypothetical protein
MRSVFPGLLLAAAALACLSGCKKEDVAAAAAEQAAEEAAQRPVITESVDITAIGLSVYPGARAVDDGELTVDMIASSAYGYLATYTTNASFERVVNWYRDQMDKPLVTVTSSDTGRSASLREDSANREEVTSRIVLVSETDDGVEIRLAADARQASFSVYLDNVPSRQEDAVVDVIATWRQDTTEGGDEWTEAEVQIAKEEARKLLTVLPRPVDVELGYDEAMELRDSLAEAGGDARILPPPGEGTDFRGPRFSGPDVDFEGVRAETSEALTDELMEEEGVAEPDPEAIEGTVDPVLDESDPSVDVEDPGLDVHGEPLIDFTPEIGEYEPAG